MAVTSPNSRRRLQHIRTIYDQILKHFPEGNRPSMLAICEVAGINSKNMHRWLAVSTGIRPKTYIDAIDRLSELLERIRNENWTYTRFVKERAAVEAQGSVREIPVNPEPKSRVIEAEATLIPELPKAEIPIVDNSLTIRINYNYLWYGFWFVIGNTTGFAARTLFL
jgi:hypothetical protein